ncbi:MAG: DUF4412 domain-containing protein [Holophagaceae bacterium]
MRRLLASALALALFIPSLAGGDLSLTMATTGRGHEGKQTHLWSSRFMRINHPEGQRDTLVDFTQGIHYTIDHKKKLIQKMSWEDLEAAMEGMAERMKNLPAFAQKLMGGGGEAQVTVEEQGSEAILGRKCKKWKITMGSTVLESSNDPSLKPPTPVGSYKRFLRLQHAIGQMGPGASSMLKLGEELAKVQGIALRSHQVMPLVGELTSVATELRDGPIPESAFALPEGYKLEDAGKKMRENLAKGR